MKTKTSRKSTPASTRTRKTSKVDRQRFDSKLFIVPQVDGNPRREGSFGHKSFQIIAKARKPVTVEEFTKKGGRLRDLHWDEQAGNVKLVKKAS